MTPVKNQWVKVIFRNSAQAEGYVEFWSDTKAILRSDEGLSLLIIQDVTADIMAVKVYPEDAVHQPPGEEPKVVVEEVQRKEELDVEFEKTRETRMEEYLKAKTLIELRKLQAEQDRKIISEKLKDHVPSTMVASKVQKYELPGFLKKQSVK